MILVDSSAWIAYFRDDGSRAAAILRDLDLRDEVIVVGDLILLEVLRGAPDEPTARRIQRELRRFEVVELGGRDAAVTAAALYRRLRGMGVTIRGSVDVLIGAFCLARGCGLLHQDRDFHAMEKHVGLVCV